MAQIIPVHVGAIPEYNLFIKCAFVGVINEYFLRGVTHSTSGFV
jgi:hypothetical protein